MTGHGEEKLVCICASVDGYRIKRRGCTVHQEKDREYWAKVDMEAKTETDSYVDIVFSGPPSHANGPRFVEVEDSSGQSIRYGYWKERDDGYWVLRVPRGMGEDI
jgi:hypothetical protein